MPRYQRLVARALALKPPIYGAYTELFCGLSSDLKVEDGWAWVEPWGKVGHLRSSIRGQCKTGGVAGRFWDWSETQTTEFA